MRLNRRGQTLSYHGAIDGEVPSGLRGIGTITKACWLNDDTVICQAENKALIPPVTLVACRLSDGLVSVVSGYGANTLRAGGGIWAAQLGNDTRVQLDFWGRPMDSFFGARTCDVSTDGQFVLSPSHQIGKNLDVYRPTGMSRASVYTTELRDDTTGPCVRLDGDVLCWIDTEGVHVIDLNALLKLPHILRVEPVNFAVPFLHPDGTWWILERTERLTIRPLDSAWGFVVHAGPGTFSPDVRVVQGVPMVAWATGAGEGDKEFAVWIQPLQEPVVDLNAEPPLPKVTIPVLDRPAFFGVFDGTTSPMNTEIRGVDKGVAELPQRPGTALLVAPDWLRVLCPTKVLDRVAGVYVSADSGTGVTLEGELIRAEPFARAWRVPMFVYDDRRGYRIEKLTGAPIDYIVLCPQLYPVQGETVARFLAWADLEVTRLVQFAGKEGVCPVVCTNDMGFLTKSDLLTLFEGYCELVARHGLIGMLCYTQTRNGHGIEGHPELLEPMQQFDAGIFGVPDLSIPSGGSMTGTVTIKSYQPDAGHAPLQVSCVAEVTGDVAFLEWRWRPVGAAAWQVATVNPVSDLNHTYAFSVPQTVEIGLRGLDSAQKAIPGAETGRQRMIEVLARVGGDLVSEALERAETAVADLRRVLGR